MRERDEAKARAAAAERDRRMADRLVEIEADFSNHTDRARLHSELESAFREYGLDFVALTVAEARARIAGSSIEDSLIDGLDRWIFNARATGDKARVDQLVAVADVADRDPWRKWLRTALGRGQLEELRRLAATADLERLPKVSASRLAFALRFNDDAASAVALLRKVQRRNRGDFWANFDMAESLLMMRPPSIEEAIQYFRAAVALRPRGAIGLEFLGRALAESGKTDEGIETCREAIRLQPTYYLARMTLANVLRGAGQLEDAIAEYKEVVRMRPDDAWVHRNLADLLYSMRRYDEGIDAYREVIRLDPRLSVLDRRLTAVFRGDDRPTGDAERLEFAHLCMMKGLHAASARLRESAFVSSPGLANDLKTYARYNGACSASLAATGQGRDDPPPDKAERARLRHLALDWLRADLSEWQRRLETNPKTAPAVAGNLRHWRSDPDLDGVRDAQALTGLAESERRDWRALWTDVNRTLLRTAKSP